MPLFHRITQFVACTAISVAFVACFHHSPSTKISPNDPTYGRRWHANLATPTELAGVAQLRGDAEWGPGADPGTSVVAVSLKNATAGGIHPWSLHHGTCASDSGIIGSAESYKPLKIHDDGTASGSSTLPIVLPSDGQYFLSVQASIENPETAVACGNFAAPGGA